MNRGRLIVIGIAALAVVAAAAIGFLLAPAVVPKTVGGTESNSLAVSLDASKPAAAPVPSPSPTPLWEAPSLPPAPLPPKHKAVPRPVKTDAPALADTPPTDVTVTTINSW